MSDSVACTACRLRRRKCDRVSPICSGCSALNIPRDLCVYHNNFRGLLKGKAEVKQVLEELKEQNKQLYEQQLKEKAHFEEVYNKSNPWPDLGPYDPSIVHDPLDYLLRERVSKRADGYFGPLSWSLLITSEPSLRVINDSFDDIVDMEKSKYDAGKNKLINEVKNESRLQKIRNRIVELTLDINEDDSLSILYDLLEEIVSKLPTYKVMRLLIAKFFQFSSTALFALDQNRLVKNFHKLFVGNEETGALELKHIPPKQIVNSLVQVSLILLVISHPLLSQFYLKNPQKQLAPQNFLLLVHYADVIISTLYSYPQIHTDLDIEFLFTIFLIRHFTGYTPFGTRDGSNGKEIRADTSEMIMWAKRFKLDQDIDSVYAHETEEFRKSLKGFWYELLMFDITEGLETGLPTGINSEQIIVYESNYKATKLIKTLSKCVNKFMKFETLLNPIELVELIENDLVYEIQASIYLCFGSIDELLDEFENMTIHQDDPQQKNQLLQINVNHVACLTAYLTIQALYCICLRKVKNYPDSFQQNQGGLSYDSILQKFTILSLKYSYLLVFSNLRTVQIFRRHLNNPKINEFNSNPIPSILRLYTIILNCFRRASAAIGARVYDLCPYTDDVITGVIAKNTDSLNKPKLEDSKLLQIVPEFFTLKELQDRRIDLDTVKLIERFGPRMLDFKAVLLNSYKLMLDFVGFLENDKVNIDFLKNNFTYFQIMKLTSFLINEFYYSDANNEFFQDYGITDQREDQLSSTRNNSDTSNYYDPPNSTTFENSSIDLNPSSTSRNTSTDGSENPPFLNLNFDSFLGIPTQESFQSYLDKSYDVDPFCNDIDESVFINDVNFDDFFRNFVDKNFSPES